jgi:hypothetical protein
MQNNKCESCGNDAQLRNGDYYKGYGCASCRIKARCEIVGDCWVWTGARRGNYGLVRVLWNGVSKLRNVHRVMLALSSPEPVRDGYSVLHNCGNKLCCNPAHLYVQVQPIRMTAETAATHT